MVVLCFICFPQNKKEEIDYLRLHIRANSNLNIDQEVKYKVKDIVVEYLTPYFSQVKSKDEAIEIVNDLSKEIETKCERVLRSNGFLYSANVKNDLYLTNREKETLALVVEGKSNTEIAKELKISANTAKAHVGNILTKLSVTDRVQAAVKAVRTKLLD